MRRTHGIRTVLLIASLLAILTGATAWSLYKERHQENLNHSLIVAVKRNDTHAVISLLAQGADANTHDEPPHRTSLWRRLLLDRLLGRKPRSSTAPTPLLLALQWKDKPKPDGNVDFPPENITLVKALLDHGAEVNTKNEHGLTLLWFALLDGKNATVHLLLARGADVRSSPNHIVAPLVDAVSPGVSTDVITDLLDHGADVNMRNIIGDTALFQATMLMRVDVVRLLLARHADLTMRGWRDYTPLDIARRNPMIPENQEIVRLLKQAGAKR